MNIFYLDSNPYEAAKQICDVHVNKMIIESCQMLSAAHHLCNPDDLPQNVMKLTHKNHPSAIWVRLSIAHYEWLYRYTLGLCHAYTTKTRKIHKCFSERLPGLAQLPSIPSLPFQEPPQCMPDAYKDACSIIAYQKYLNAKYAEWSTRERPMKISFTHNTPKWFDLTHND